LREFLQPFHFLNLNDAIMQQFAALRVDLRRRGQIIPDFDLLLAATALHHDLTILTRNARHFGRISDLTLSQPS
jgi:predicted nucleic acid-binding protein